MSMELGLWRVDGQPVRLTPAGAPLEKALEDLIENDPDILGEPLMIIGRQVPTSHGKILDLLAVDGDGVLHAIELKRDKTPREATAQALDYGSWVQTLAHNDVLDLFDRYRPGEPSNKGSLTDSAQRLPTDQHLSSPYHRRQQ